MLGSSIVSYKDHSKEFLGAYVDWQRGLTFQIPYSPTGMGEADHVAGCALMIKADVARQIGLLDAEYFLYFEDSDWGVRCNQAGYRVITVFQSKVYHKGTPDATAHESPALLYYYRRNQCYFMRKFTPRKQWLLFLVRYAWQCLKQFYYYARILERAKADAIIGGFWAGITGRYGAERIQAPRWLWWSAYYSMNAGYKLVLSPFRLLKKRFSKRTLPFGTHEVLE
jgi:GT2 family glycosyltransferase